MWKSLLFWLAAFGISFLAAPAVGMNPNEMFFWIYIGLTFLVLIILVICLIVFGISERNAEIAIGMSSAAVLILAVKVALVLGAAWLMSQYFQLDFFIVYVLMSLGASFTSSDKGKDD